MIMKNYLHLFLLLFAFVGFANAQPSSTAHWFGYILPPNQAENKYISFTMQDLGSVSIASDELPAVSTATFADGYVWSVNNVYGYCLYRSRFDATTNRIEDPELMVEDVPYFNDMVYNPADGLIYVITEEHLKSFDPANPNDMQDHGAIEHDGFNLAIDTEGNAYMISSWGEFGSLNLSNAQLTVINPIDLPIKMAFDMLTGELFGTYYGNLYQINTNTGAYTVSAFLIAQIGKNYLARNGDLISGEELLALARNRLLTAKEQIGGQIVFVEMEHGNDKFAKFYADNGFVQFGTRDDIESGITYDQLFLFLK